MFKYLVFFCIIATAFAKPGILTPSLRIAAGPAIVSAPIVRTAPIALGGGLVSGGLVSGAILNGGLVSGRLLSGGLVSGGLASGLIH